MPAAAGRGERALIAADAAAARLLDAVLALMPVRMTHVVHGAAMLLLFGFVLDMRALAGIDHPSALGPVMHFVTMCHIKLLQAVMDCKAFSVTAPVTVVVELRRRPAIGESMV